MLQRWHLAVLLLLLPVTISCVHANGLQSIANSGQARVAKDRDGLTAPVSSTTTPGNPKIGAAKISDVCERLSSISSPYKTQEMRSRFHPEDAPALTAILRDGARSNLRVPASYALALVGKPEQVFDTIVAFVGEYEDPRLFRNGEDSPYFALAAILAKMKTVEALGLLPVPVSGGFLRRNIEHTDAEKMLQDWKGKPLPPSLTMEQLRAWFRNACLTALVSLGDKESDKVLEETFARVTREKPKEMEEAAFVGDLQMALILRDLRDEVGLDEAFVLLGSDERVSTGVIASHIAKYSIPTQY